MVDILNFIEGFDNIILILYRVPHRKEVEKRIGRGFEVEGWIGEISNYEIHVIRDFYRILVLVFLIMIIHYYYALKL